MKKKYLFSLIAITSISILSFSNLQSEPNGSPAAASGGSAEGNATCSQGGCHFGSATSGATFMSTDIPAEGYTPGMQYNITMSITGTGKKGFMFSAQTGSGQFMGTLTSGTGSKVTLTNYITHSSAKTSSPGVWTFKWTAPAAGTGAVNLHAAFAVTRSTTSTQVITVNEKLSSGLNELAQEMGLNTYFNATEKQVELAFNLKNSNNVTVSLINMSGQVCAELFNGSLQSGEQHLSASTAALKAGVYFTQIRVGDQVAIKKVAITE